MRCRESYFSSCQVPRGRAFEVHGGDKDDKARLCMRRRRGYLVSRSTLAAKSGKRQTGLRAAKAQCFRTDAHAHRSWTGERLGRRIRAPPSAVRLRPASSFDAFEQKATCAAGPKWQRPQYRCFDYMCLEATEGDAFQSGTRAAACVS